jgi:hypothetical protein
MSSIPIHPQADQPRKKIRKGTRSCWQCIRAPFGLNDLSLTFFFPAHIGKHRKVRCNYASDSAQSCRECLARGLPCRSQEFPEPENLRDSDRTYLNERMARVETLLEKLLIRVDGGSNASNGSIGSNQQWDSKSPIDWAETSPESSPPTVTPAPDNAPILSLFNNQAVSIITRTGGL